ncbi:MAG: DUF6526 family protein [Gemmatimonadales bacterium]
MFTQEDTMAAERPQDLKNHRRWLPPFHFFALPVMLANVVATIWHVVRHPSPWGYWQVVVAFALFTAVLMSRVMVSVVQDRVIRLEMRLRLRDVLPAALAARITDLTPKQLVGLRFACDAELPALVERCLAGELKNDEAVKKVVKTWQPDWLRA